MKARATRGRMAAMIAAVCVMAGLGMLAVGRKR